MVQVAILTPAWLDTPDKVAWLREAGESILGQDFEDWEWIVYDDASPLTLDLPPDVRIRSVRGQRRQGPAAGRNTAASLARADAFIALDADDLLAAPDVLSVLMDHWRRRPDRFYYGNLQILQGGVPGKLVEFPIYNFLHTLEPSGPVPVTALHSREAWYKAGGWKPELEHGLEDVEYWIACGKAGFCGYKVDLTAILYRKHPTSRSAAMRSDGAKRQSEMVARIREMHADVYGGNLPMGCCGGGRSASSSTALPVAQPRPRALATDDLPGGKVWVRYNGERTGTFGIRGQVTGTRYEVDGKGSEFQIHAQDAHYFRNLGRGKDFSVGIAAPVQETPPAPAPVEVPAYTPPPPVPAAIERLDPVAANVIKFEDGGEPAFAQRAIEQVGEKPDAAELFEAAKDHPLAALSIPAKVKEMLEAERWTVPALARAIPEELVPYPGIGKKTAADIIAEAQRLWST